MARSLQFDIVANDKATGKINAVEGALGNFGKKLGGMVTGFFALERVIGMVADQFARSFEWGQGLKDSAAAVGLNTTQLQQLEYAAKQSGIETGKLQRAFLDLRKTVRDAAGGNQQALAVLNALGYSQADAANGSIDYMDALLRVSAAVSAAKTEQDKFNVVTAVFGDRIAQDLIPALSNYAELKKLISAAPVLGENEANVLDKFGDRLDDASDKVRVLTARIIAMAENPIVQKMLMAMLPGALIGPTWTTQKLLGPNETSVPVEGPSQQAMNTANALAAAGKKTASQSNAAATAAANGNLPSMAAIGGAAGFMGGAGGVPRSETLLEQIEQNTRPASPVAPNGATNFTSGNYNAEMVEYNATVAAIKFGPRRRDIAPR